MEAQSPRSHALRGFCCFLLWKAKRVYSENSESYYNLFMHITIYVRVIQAFDRGILPEVIITLSAASVLNIAAKQKTE